MSALAGRLAEALKMCASVLADDGGTDANDWIDAELAARTALAAWDSRPNVGCFPTDFAREKLASYDAGIEAGNPEYAYHAGLFSQIVRGMVE